MLSEHDGRFLLEVARETITNHVSRKRISKPPEYPACLDKKHGVFCTIKGSEKLRGCIGIPYPVMPLIDALISAASSACEDCRFKPLSKEELDKIKIEVSVLTEPELIGNPNAISIGKDGLIISYGFYSGLLLPQVAVEEKWGTEEFMDHLCLKAGLLPGMWKEKNAKLYKFQAQIFTEE